MLEPSTETGPFRERAERIAVLAPFAGDAAVIEGLLRQASISVETAGNMVGLSACVRAGVGAVLLTQEALTVEGVERLTALLNAQPSWSDLPVLLLLTETETRGSGAAGYERLLGSSSSVTVLRRPVPSITLLTQIQSALRARRRQYELRDLLTSERCARERAEAAVRVQDAFLASVSHELRTPLSAILIWGKLLAAGRVKAEQVQTALDAIVSGAESQSRLIEDLLDTAAMTSGKLRLIMTPCSLQDSLLAAIEVVRPTATAHGVKLQLQLEDSSSFVFGDAQRLQQVFWNLVSNAVKFSGTGGTVSVSLKEEPGYFDVSVADDGQGIEPGQLLLIFDRFWQANLKGSRVANEGLGLGLSIVRQLVELHGGSVDAASAGTGLGATFVVRLPKAVSADRPVASG